MSTKSLSGAFGSLMGSVATAADGTSRIIQTVVNGVEAAATVVDVAQIHANEWKTVAEHTARANTNERIKRAYVSAISETAELLSEIDRKRTADPKFAHYYDQAAALDLRFKATGNVSSFFTTDEAKAKTTVTVVADNSEATAA